VPSVTELQHDAEGTAKLCGQDTGMTPLVFESCHSTWHFDTAQRRFRRILKGATVDGASVASGWRQFYGLEVDPYSESFTVLLNPAGTRLLRSWRHTHDCAQCGGHATEELALGELRRAVG
jgi:hypothetical protein